MMRLGIGKSSPVALRRFHQASVRSSLFNKQKANLPPQAADIPNDEAFQRHPILKRVPKFLRPYTSSFINAPISHVVSFVVLHEITAIVPLVGVWWFIHKYQIHLPIDLPSWAIDKGTKVIDSSLKRFDFSTFSLNEKFNFIMEGAYAFVLVKLLLPVRIVVSLTLMPWFAKWFVIPFTKMFSRKKVSETAPLPEVKVKAITKPRL